MRELALDEMEMVAGGQTQWTFTGEPISTIDQQALIDETLESISVGVLTGSVAGTLTGAVGTPVAGLVVGSIAGTVGAAINFNLSHAVTTVTPVVNVYEVSDDDK